MDIRMYVAAHKRYQRSLDDCYISLQVGSEGKENLGYLCDNTGDNISWKNENYCELTGMYWMWKNVKCDIIGLCHYRRFFVENQTILRREEIEELMGQYDLVIAAGAKSQEGSARAHYVSRHEEKDLSTCGAVIRDLCPEYYPAFERTLDSNLMSLANMLIAPKAIYDEYCAWLFAILFEVEKRTDLSGYDAYQRRIYGFLSERLIRVWLMMQAYRVGEVHVEMIE